MTIEYNYCKKKKELKKPYIIKNKKTTSIVRFQTSYIVIIIFFKSGKSYLEHGVHEHYRNSITVLNVLGLKMYTLLHNLHILHTVILKTLIKYSVNAKKQLY